MCNVNSCLCRNAASFSRTAYSLFGHFLSLPFVYVTQSSSSGKADVKPVLVWGTRAVGGDTIASGGFSCLWFWELEERCSVCLACGVGRTAGNSGFPSDAEIASLQLLLPSSSCLLVFSSNLMYCLVLSLTSTSAEGID